MSATAEQRPSQDGAARGTLSLIARNVSTRYLAIGVEAALGIVILPFNIAHLGKSQYGLWMLAASITAYFSVLDLGYSGSLVKFVAQYRARRDWQAINEILSTLFFIFAAVGVLAWLVAAFVGFHLDSLFSLTAEQARTGQIVLLIISANVACGFAFSVFGGVINGFQRYDLNNFVGAASSLVAAAVNVGVLLAGGSLVMLVAATTAVRLATYFIYRMNAYRVLPNLRLRPGLMRKARLREVTSFSIFILMLDWASKLNYSVDAIVVGGFLGTAAVATWTVAQRLIEVTQRLTSQLNDILFPTVVDSDAGQRAERLRAIFLQGTRLSLATVLPAACALIVLASPLIAGWVGPSFEQSAFVTQILAATVAIRVGTSVATTVLKGAGGHRLLAGTNLVTAGANLLLSLWLVGRIGLPGVAIGTFVPVTIASVFVLFPAACRRVDVSLRRALLAGVLPALWPAVLMTGWMLLVRPYVPDSLPYVGLHAAFAGGLYLALFLGLGVPKAERQLYLSLAAGLLGLQRRLQTTG